MKKPRPKLQDQDLLQAPSNPSKISPSRQGQPKSRKINFLNVCFNQCFGPQFRFSTLDYSFGPYNNYKNPKNFVRVRENDHKIQIFYFFLRCSLLLDLRSIFFFFLAWDRTSKVCVNEVEAPLIYMLLMRSNSLLLG